MTRKITMFAATLSGDDVKNSQGEKAQDAVAVVSNNLKNAFTK